MVLEWISIAVGLVGFGWAGWKDLRTTEFPDWLPYSLIIVALLLNGAFSVLEGSFAPLINSGFVGMAFLALGLLLYYSKQWGDGDAWLLGAMGFLFPGGIGAVQGVLPSPVVMLFTFFFVAFFYILIYSIGIGLISKRNKKFVQKMEKDILRILGLTVVFTIALVGFVQWFAPKAFAFVYVFPLLLFLLLLFFHYGKFIESTVFRKRISVKQLREGDVPVKEKWRVLNKKEVAALKRKGGYIWIKEGIRFAPAFVITIATMLLYGDLWSFVVSLI